MVNQIRKNSKGFTLVELIVVIAIIGILSAVLVPSYIYFTERADKAALLSEAKIAEPYFDGLKLDGDLDLSGTAYADRTVANTALLAKLAYKENYTQLIDELNNKAGVAFAFTYTGSDGQSNWVVTGFTYRNESYTVTFDSATNSFGEVTSIA